MPENWKNTVFYKTIPNLNNTLIVSIFDGSVILWIELSSEIKSTIQMTTDLHLENISSISFSISISSFMYLSIKFHSGLNK